MHSSKSSFRVSVVALATLILLIAPSTFAQATRTWVSGVGDDANPCSRTAPCKTFQGAISKTAAGGEMNAIDPGGFGGVTITKSMTINGYGQHTSLLAAGTNGVIINAASTDTITLRYLSINGASTGIDGVRIIGNTGRVYIEECDIFQFTNKGINDQRTGGGNLTVVNTVVRNINNATAAQAFGIHVQPSTGTVPIHVVLDGVKAYGNKISGAFFGTSVKASVTHSTFTGNSAGVTLFPAAGQSCSATLDHVTIASNTVNGLELVTGGTARLTNTTISNNTTNGVLFGGGSGLSYGTNNIDGNGGNNGAGLVLIGTGQQ